MPRFSWLVLAAVLLGGEAHRPLSAQAPGDSMALAGTRVTVSRREVRVVFPRDSGTVWGWRSERPDVDDEFRWWISADGVDIGRSLGVSVPPPAKGSLRFSSLRSFLAHGEATLCVPGMIRQCGWKRMSLAEDSGRVVVVLRDSATISRWFGLRPPTVSAGHRRPGFEADARAVPVEYVRPQIPLPDSALRAEAAASRRRERSHRLTRQIGGGEPHYGAALWMAVGDSAALRVEESRCQSDVCGGNVVRNAVTWAVLDSSVARLGPEDGDTRRRRSRGYARSLFALRPGRTRIHVANLPPDSLALRPAPLELFRDVVVTQPVRRVEILANRETLQMGERVVLRAEVFDREGARLHEPPVSLVISIHGPRHWHTLSRPLSWEPWKAGRYTLTATFGGITARRVIEVTKAPPPKPSPGSAER